MNMINKFHNILQNALDLRKEYVEKNNLEAYRLYDRENNKLSEVAVDVFKDWCVVQVYGKMPEKKLSQVIEALDRGMNFRGVYSKDRTKEDLSKASQGLVAGEEHPQEFTIQENGKTFWINLRDYLDSGIFLDSREVREIVGKLSKKARVLNLFAYTATASVYAGTAGAKEVVSVDISGTFLDWGKRNFELNGLDLERQTIVVHEVMDFINSEKGRPEKYDLIIIDPPTFSHAKKRDFSVQKDHVRLINDCIYALKPNGKIIFTTHYRDFKMVKPKIRAKIKEITDSVIPFDFFRKNIFRAFIITHSPRWER